MNKILFLALICASQMAFASTRPLPFLNKQDLTPFWPTETQKYIPATIEKFALENQDQKSVTEEKLKGKVSILHFFFGTCGSVCPILIHNVQDLQKKLSQNSQTHFFSISVMPEEDTPEALRAYAKRAKLNLKNWDLVTGDRKEIFRLGRGTLRADQGDSESTAKASFVHNQNVYLIDPQLKIRGIYDGGSRESLALLIKDAQALTKE